MKLDKFRPGWWVFVLGRNEETNELALVALDLKRYDSARDAGRMRFEDLRPLSWNAQVHYAVIDTRFVHTTDGLREIMCTYELQWNTTAAQADPVSFRLELEKLRRVH